MSKKIWLRTSVVAILVCVVCLSAMRPVLAADHISGAPKWHPWFELGGFYNSGDDICDISGGAGFAGTVAFTDGIILQQGQGAPLCP